MFQVPYKMISPNEEIKRSAELDQETGDQSFRYFCGDEECQAEYPSGELANQHVGYDLILHDLTCAERWVNIAYKIIDTHSSNRPDPGGHIDVFLPSLDADEHNSLMAFFISSITFYAKCFTQAEGRRVRLHRSNIGQMYRAKHDMIMGFRNNIAAHSGEGPWDDGKLARIEHPITGDLVVWSELKILQFYDDREDKASYSNLLSLLIKETRERFPRLRDALLESET